MPKLCASRSNHQNVLVAAAVVTNPYFPPRSRVVRYPMPRSQPDIAFLKPWEDSIKALLSVVIDDRMQHRIAQPRDPEGLDIGWKDTVSL